MILSAAECKKQSTTCRKKLSHTFTLLINGDALAQPSFKAVSKFSMTFQHNKNNKNIIYILIYMTNNL